MKKLVLLFTLLLVSQLSLQGQEDIALHHGLVEQTPQFKGCDYSTKEYEGFKIYINDVVECENEKWGEIFNNIDIPETYKGKIKTRIVITYGVSSKGKLIDLNLRISTRDTTLENLLKKETKRVMNKYFPKLIPAKHNGKNVSVYGINKSIGLDL